MLLRSISARIWHDQASGHFRAPGRLSNLCHRSGHSLSPDEGPASLDAVDEALLDQGVDGLPDSAASQAMFLHEGGFRGHDPAGRQLAGLDLGPEDAGTFAERRCEAVSAEWLSAQPRRLRDEDP